LADLAKVEPLVRVRVFWVILRHLPLQQAIFHQLRCLLTTWSTASRPFHTIK